MAKMDPMDRFMRHASRCPSGCWVWTASTGGSKTRYGYFRPGSKQTDPRVMAHRWIYEQSIGPIPEGYEVDHLCRNRLCVYPAHLEPVTPAENSRRARLKVCRAGLHDLTDPENCMWDQRGRRRGCKPCNRIDSRRIARERKG